MKVQTLARQMLYHWTFLFVWLSWATYQWFHWSALGLIILLGLTVRLWTLPRPFKKVWFVLSCVFIVLWSIDAYKERQVPTLLEESTSGVLRTNPLDLMVEETTVKGEGTLYLTDQKPIKIRFYATLDEAKDLLKDIHYLKVNGEISKPNRARNFYVFDYRAYLKTQRIYWQMNVEEIELIDPPATFKDRIDRLKIFILKPLLKVQDNVWIGWMKKLLFNMNSTYYTQFQDDLSYLGIVHFFAISGFHIQYFSKYVRYGLLRMGMSIEMTQWVIVLIFVIYGWLIRWPVGAMRAIGSLILRASIKPNFIPLSQKDRLAIVGISTLASNIRLVSSLGFLLSFLMTYLILFYQQQLMKRSKPIPSWLITIEMTAMCLFFSWPILLHHHFEWHPYQLFLIIIIACLFEWVWMPVMVFTCGAFYLFPEFVLKWTTFSSFYLTDYWQESLTWLRSYFQPLIIGRQGNSYYFGLFVLASIWLHFIGQSRKKAYSFYLPCLWVWIFLLPHLRWSSQLTVLDVGQGDALLYQPAWSTRHWLIDTGGRLNWKALQQPELKEPQISLTHQQKVLIPALKALGVHRLTGVVVTHADLDHMGNLYQLDQYIPIESVFYTTHASQDSFFNEVLNTLNIKIQHVILNNGERFSVKNLSLLHLKYAANYMTMEDNDTSLLVYIQMGPYGFLNMGDLSLEYERLLINQYPHLKVDGLKLGHHGSKTSTSEEFLKHYQPAIAYISAGVNNRYHHPHPEVILRLKEHHIPSVATIQRGAIQWRYSFLGGLKIKYALTSDLSKE